MTFHLKGISLSEFLSVLTALTVKLQERMQEGRREGEEREIWLVEPHLELLLKYHTFKARNTTIHTNSHNQRISSVHELKQFSSFFNELFSGAKNEI